MVFTKVNDAAVAKRKLVSSRDWVAVTGAVMVSFLLPPRTVMSLRTHHMSHGLRASNFRFKTFQNLFFLPSAFLCILYVVLLYHNNAYEGR